MELKHLLFHISTYYIAWFACVLSSAHQLPWVGAILAFMIFLIQWAWQKHINDTQHLLSFVLIFTFSGFLVDTFFLNLNIIHFSTNPWPLSISPPWMIMLWVNFSMVLYACAKHVFDYYVILGILSFVGFPLAYLAGILLGAASMPEGNIWVLIYGLIWGVLLPALIFIYQMKLRGK